MAQATIYGRSDIAYGVKATQMGTGGTGVKQLGVMDGGNAGSRIGFKGTEELGGGMKAHFVTEQGISPTNASVFGVRTATAGAQYDGYASSTGQFDPGSAGGYSQGTNRQTYVALEGEFGTVRVGYQYTTIYEIATLSGFTQTSEGMSGGSIAHLWGNGAAGGTRANGIRYISPKLAGAWTVGIDMGSTTGRENTEFVGVTNTADGRLLNKAARTALHIDYNAGPLRAAFGYTTLDQNQGGQLANNAAGALGAAAGDVAFAVASGEGGFLGSYSGTSRRISSTIFWRSRQC
jgi:predicted porin